MRCLLALCATVAGQQLAAAIIVRGNSSSSKEASSPAVDCSNEVSRLSDETSRLLSEHQQIDRGCANAKKYYKDMIALVDQSITHLEAGNANADSDAELEARYEKRYTNSMCSKTYEAFFLKDEDARLNVLHICMGRKSLAPSSLLHHQVRVDIRRCPQAEDMQDRVDMLRAAKATKAAECRAQKQTLKNELEEKRAKEDKLEDEYYGNHNDKSEIRSKAASKVESKFCTVIQANYKLREENIKAFWVKECPA